MQEKLPQRKQLRLKEYDYSQEGYYFITICTKNRKELLSKILSNSKDKSDNVGVAVLGDPQIELTKIGRIVEKYLQNYNKFFENIFVDEYVIMPNHIHFIIALSKRVAGGGDPYNTQNNKFVQINCNKTNWIFYLAT